MNPQVVFLKPRLSIAVAATGLAVAVQATKPKPDAQVRAVEPKLKLTA